MSIVNNAYVAIAATAIGVVVTPGALPIVDQLLNDVEVSKVEAAEVTAKGKCLVLVTVVTEDGNEVRPVADANGSVKLFADGAAVVALAKRSNLPGGSSVSIVKRAANNPVGDPITALKTQHKAAVREAAAALKPANDLVAKVSGATSLGWNTDPVGSATRAEYEDLIDRQDTIAEWKDKCDARVTQLANALTAAGINPSTYLPL